MKSAGACNFLKANGKQSVLWDGEVRRKAGRGSTTAPETSRLPQEGTDYRGKPPLESLPLKLRARYMTTAQGEQNRQIHPSILPQSRNVGNTIWRRYPNGALDIRDAVSKLREALRRFKMGGPINEGDALVISSVFPEYEFEGLPPEIVKIKAFLAHDEMVALKEENARLKKEDTLRAIVDLGGP